jgi:hypothetical protein
MLGMTRNVAIIRGAQRRRLNTAVRQHGCISRDGSVRPLEQRRGHRYADRSGCLEVDDQFVTGQTLHGQCARLGAFENLVHVRGQLSSRLARLVPYAIKPPQSP